MQADIGDVAGDPKEGPPADIPALEVRTGRFPLTDMAGAGRTDRRAIAPVVTIKDGRAYEPSGGAHPWGLAPPVAE